MPRGHRLAAKRVINLSDAAAEPWIDIRCEVGCCRDVTRPAIDGTTPVQAMITTLQAEADAQPTQK